MVEAQVDNILKKTHLSLTDSRKKILELFIKAGTALAHHDIEKKTNGEFDRVTVYRTLQTFMDKGLIHTIPSADNSVKYALCKDQCAEGHHHDHHIHFVCQKCGSTICLEDAVVPEVKLPRGYRSIQVEVVVSGTCREWS